MTLTTAQVASFETPHANDVLENSVFQIKEGFKESHCMLLLCCVSARLFEESFIRLSSCSKMDLF